MGLRQHFRDVEVGKREGLMPQILENKHKVSVRDEETKKFVKIQRRIRGKNGEWRSR